MAMIFQKVNTVVLAVLTIKETFMKTITMMQLRASPGEYAFRVRADGETFVVTYQGKPCFKMAPVDDMTIVKSDGTFKGPRPLTMGLNLGGNY